MGEYTSEYRKCKSAIDREYIGHCSYAEYLRELIAENPGIDIMCDNTYRLNDKADIMSEVLLLLYDVEISLNSKIGDENE